VEVYEELNPQELESSNEYRRRDFEVEQESVN
jgi:hypothetical protein